MTPLATFSAEKEGTGRIALCSFCADQHRADPNAIAIEPIPVCVHAGHCHDCGAGWCECRGAFPCNYCPRRNSPVVLLSPLVLYRLLSPRAPSTMPGPVER